MRSKKYVLDSYAVLAVIEGETGAQIVADIVAGEETELYMSIISLGEIYYIRPSHGRRGRGKLRGFE